MTTRCCLMITIWAAVSAAQQPHAGLLISCQQPAVILSDPEVTSWSCFAPSSSMQLLLEQEADGIWFVQCRDGQPDQPQPDDGLRQPPPDLGSIDALRLDDCLVDALQPTSNRLDELMAALSVHQVRALYLEIRTAGRLEPDLGPESAAPDASPIYGLQLLELSRAGVHKLSRRFFSPVARLKHLIIRDTSLTSIPADLLSDLVDLQTLELYNNRGLHTLPASLLRGLRHLTTLNMSRNDLHYLPEDLLRGLDNLQEVVLSGNRFAVVSEDLFVHSPKLEVIRWLHDACLDTTSSPASCVRRFPSGLLRANSHLRRFEYSVFNGVADRVPPAPFFPPELFEAAALSLDTLHIVQTFALGRDELVPVWRGLRNLTTLYIYANDIRSLGYGDIPQTVTDLRISGNDFLLCDCSTISYISSLHTKKAVSDYDLIKCRLPPDQSAAGSAPLPMTVGLQQAAFQMQCANSTADGSGESRTMNTSLTVAFVALLLILILVVLLVMRRCPDAICMKCYYHRIWGHFYPIWWNANAGDGTLPMKYDVFISFASADESLAASIVDKLENGQVQGRRFRCCVHDRDWLPGIEIMRNIVDSVMSSHRTIIILSKAYLQSPYCSQEFMEAASRSKLLLIMRVDPVSGLPQVTDDDLRQRFPTILSYIKKYTYLQEQSASRCSGDDQEFWNKLVFRLPHKRLSQSATLKRHRSQELCDEELHSF